MGYPKQHPGTALSWEAGVSGILMVADWEALRLTHQLLAWRGVRLSRALTEALPHPWATGPAGRRNEGSSHHPSPIPLHPCHQDQERRRLDEAEKVRRLHEEMEEEEQEKERRKEKVRGGDGDRVPIPPV